ncbi:hypothetical protein DHW03_18665 [Pedobacter yonginense]|uniref:Uncharacterized protein n=1 Tax=Pedobacter yonginense TaxID=651869 RepID=A0A317EIZ1_9SPHI|nr:hypothetical protein [Pedobacter yonginense]PWS26069.1 hypothetical protein DHW03_18665 [Pedobacter yonginense]
MRKIFAILFTVITVFAIKETVYIFTSTDADIANQRSQLELTALSITVPLVILTLWLWISSRKIKQH